MKAAKVLYLKKTQSHFNEAMRLNGERGGTAIPWGKNWQSMYLCPSSVWSYRAESV